MSATTTFNIDVGIKFRVFQLLEQAQEINFQQARQQYQAAQQTGDPTEIEKKKNIYKLELKKKKMIAIATDETFNQIYDEQLEIDLNEIEENQSDDETAQILQRVNYYSEFIEQHKKEIEIFGKVNYEGSQECLEKYPALVCQETLHFLAAWSIDLRVDEEFFLMTRLTHQTIIMQFILELNKDLKDDPRQCIQSFFTRMEAADGQYKREFWDRLTAFRECVENCAQKKNEDADEQYKEEQKRKHLDPIGSDPTEVMESSTQEFQEYFESGDVAQVQEVLAKMPSEQADHHHDRCSKSDSWISNAKDADGDGDGEEEARNDEEKVKEDVGK